MILINLLPHRQEKRQRRKIAFFIGLGVAAGVGLLLVGAWYAVLAQLTSAQQERNRFLTSEISKLEAEIKDIASLRADIESLKARQRAVEDLQTNRNVPVHLLNELARQVPEGVYLTSIKQAGAVVNVTGQAQTNERVSELLRNTANQSEWLERPELIEIKGAGTQGGQAAARADGRRLFDFSMRIYVKQPPTAAAAASAPAAAGTRRASAGAPKP